MGYLRDKTPDIEPSMTILDVVSAYRQTEAVFKRYDEKTGACLCCQALFESLHDVSEKYGLDLNHLLADLKQAAGEIAHSPEQ